MKPRNVAIAILLALGVGILLWVLSEPGSGPSAIDPLQDSSRSTTTTDDDPTDDLPGPIKTTTADLDGASDLTTATAEVAESPFFIEGQIFGDGSRPVAGADVRVYSHRPLLTIHELTDLFAYVRNPQPQAHQSAVTDAQGNFRIPLPRAGRYLIEARSTGYASVIEAPIRLTSREPGALLFLHMQPDVAIVGRVVDSSGRPILDTAVFLLEKVEGPRSFHTHRSRTNGRGEFAFEGLGGHSYILMCRPDGRAGVVLPKLVPPLENLEVTVPDAARIETLVISAKDGTPVAGARITALNPQSYDQVSTNEEGTALLLLGGTDADVVVHHPDHVVLEQRVLLQSDGAIVLELNPGWHLPGRVVDAEDRPVSGVEVALLQSAVVLTDLRATATDANGEFTVGPVRDGAGWRVLARHGNRFARFDDPHSFEFDLDAKGQPMVQLRLRDHASLRGVLRDATGRPIPDADVRLVHSNPESLLGRSIRWLRGDQQTFSAADGSFEFERVVPEAGYVLELSHPETADRAVELTEFPEHAIDLELEPGVTLTGVVLDRVTDQPLSAQIFAEWEGSRPVRLDRESMTFSGGTRFTADADGKFWIDRLPIGTVTLYVQRPPYIGRRIEIETRAGENDPITIELNEPF